MGAAAGVVAAVSAASPQELQAALAGLSEESRAKLRLALADGVAKEPAKPELAWQRAFVISGAMACKDVPRARKLAEADAAIQVKEEPKSPRFAVLGAPTGSSRGAAEAPAELTKDRMFWLAEFESLEAWDGPDHKERATNKEFMKAFSETAMSGSMMEDMKGSYTGPAWHLEKPGGASCDAFAILVIGKAKDAASAQALLEINKAHGLEQLQAEPGALRYTVCMFADLAGPLAKDDTVVQWIEVWRTKEDYAAHKETPHLAKNAPKMLALLDAEQPVFTILEFGAVKHFAK